MADAGWMISAIEGDRERRPQIEFWGDWLYRVDIPERSLALPFGDVCSIYHIHRFDSRGKLFLSSSVRLARVILVFTWCLPPLVFGV